MSSKSETGHAINVANFEELISFCKGFGASYNPSKDALLIKNLEILHTTAKDGLQKTITTKTSFDIATNERKIAFKDLKPLATKIINALAVSGASPLTLLNAKTINRKIQGTKASVTSIAPPPTSQPTEEVATIKNISSSQQSFDSMVEHFTKLIENLLQDGFYKPNETALQTVTLQARLSGLKNANSLSINAFTNWSNARLQRNSIVYNPLTGLIQTALDIKKYVKSVFDSGSPEFKQISSLEFTNLKGN